MNSLSLWVSGQWGSRGHEPQPSQADIHEALGYPAECVENLVAGDITDLSHRMKKSSSYPKETTIG